MFEYDAFGISIGAVLMQDRQPIAYESQKLNEVEKRFSTYDKEMLAIKQALEKFVDILWAASLW